MAITVSGLVPCNRNFSLILASVLGPGISLWSCANVFSSFVSSRGMWCNCPCRWPTMRCRSTQYNAHKCSCSSRQADSNCKEEYFPVSTWSRPTPRCVGSYTLRNFCSVALTRRLSTGLNRHLSGGMCPVDQCGGLVSVRPADGGSAATAPLPRPFPFEEGFFRFNLCLYVLQMSCAAPTATCNNSPATCIVSGSALMPFCSTSWVPPLGGSRPSATSAPPSESPSSSCGLASWSSTLAQ
mmetsp:Transcript_119074/g.333605  ORF Transcript_119074/g.333605 Transcript_119074/m.333605 type:complete len:240 (-) Transcript_119074:255-974(-)